MARALRLHETGTALGDGEDLPRDLDVPSPTWYFGEDEEEELSSMRVDTPSNDNDILADPESEIMWTVCVKVERLDAYIADAYASLRNKCGYDLRRLRSLVNWAIIENRLVDDIVSV